MNIKTKSQSGFTIVELLIVVVVIAILAAITLVSFNNITNRANQSSAKETAANVRKKAELYNAEKSVYPTQANLVATTTDSWSLASTIFTTDATTAPTTSNGKTAVQYVPCGTSPNFTGAKIIYYNFGATDGTAVSGSTTLNLITVGVGCTNP